MNWFYYVGRVFTRITLFLLARWRVIGKENVPPKGPLLIVANHLSLADPPVIAVSIRRKMLFMAKEELFRSRFTGYFIKGYGAFPVYRDRIDRAALKQSEQWLARGQALMMFPEGSRSPNGQLQPALAGSALIASRNRTPILPIGIFGSEEVEKKGWWRRRPIITVNIGKPFHLPLADSKSRAEFERLTHFMMEHIAELLPPAYRGYYTRKNNED